MDVSKSHRAFLPLILLTFLSACSDKRPAEEVFPKTSASCQGTEIKGHYIVQWKTGVTTYETAENREEFIKNFVEGNIELIQYVQTNQHIEFAPPGAMTETLSAMDGPPGFVENWGAENISAAGAWEMGAKGLGIIVAVVDSGIDYQHPQLVNQIAYNIGESGTDAQGRDRATNNVDDDGNGFIDDYAGYDFYNNRSLSSTPNFYADHGTHVAGIIAAEHDDRFVRTDKVQGIAPSAKILPLKFIDRDGGDLINALKAIDYAVLRGARVINASWGGSKCAPTLSQKISSLTTEGVLFISAAGNSGANIDKEMEFPASFNLPSQITVGSISPSSVLSEFSNYGDNAVHLFAPGQEIYSTVTAGSGSYAVMDGTSMAAPFVAGAAAALMSLKPSATIDSIREALVRSVVIDSNYRNASTGRLNLLEAAKYLKSH